MANFTNYINTRSRYLYTIVFSLSPFQGTTLNGANPLNSQSTHTLSRSAARRADGFSRLLEFTRQQRVTPEGSPARQLSAPGRYEVTQSLPVTSFGAKSLDNILESEICDSIVPIETIDKDIDDQEPSATTIVHSDDVTPGDYETTLSHSPTTVTEHEPAEVSEDLEHKPAEVSEELEYKPAEASEDLEHEPAEASEELEHEPAKVSEDLEHEIAEFSEELEHEPAEVSEELEEAVVTTSEEGLITEEKADNDGDVTYETVLETRDELGESDKVEELEKQETEDKQSELNKDSNVTHELQEFVLEAPVEINQLGEPNKQEEVEKQEIEDTLSERNKEKDVAHEPQGSVLEIPAEIYQLGEPDKPKTLETEDKQSEQDELDKQETHDELSIQRDDPLDIEMGEIQEDEIAENDLNDSNAVDITEDQEPVAQLKATDEPSEMTLRQRHPPSNHSPLTTESSSALSTPPVQHVGALGRLQRSVRHWLPSVHSGLIVLSVVALSSIVVYVSISYSRTGAL